MMTVYPGLPERLSHLKGPAVSFDLTDALGHYGYIVLVGGKQPDYADIHIVLDRWNHRVLRDMKRELLPELKQTCRKLGIRYLVGKKQGYDPLWGKFIRHFGFSAPETVQIARMEV